MCMYLWRLGLGTGKARREARGEADLVVVMVMATRNADSAALKRTVARYRN